MSDSFIINNFWRFWYDMDTPWSMAFYLFYILGLLSTNPLYFHNLKILRKTNAIFFQKKARAKMNTDSLFLEAVKVHMTRISIFLQPKNAQTRTDSYCGKSNASKKRQCHFLQTQTIHNSFFNRILFRKMGVGPEGLRKRKALAPIFRKKFY